MDYEQLMQKAKEASQNAYCAYSKFPAGACILTASGNTYTGCNVENASFGLTVCAERNAAAAAIVNGEREFKAIAIYAQRMENCTPCGACRQVLNEFATPEMAVVTWTSDGLKTYTLGELLPEGFEFVPH
jgi:cytidine deaminase